MTKNLKKIFDSFLPRLCVACNKKLEISDDIICVNCLSTFELVSNDLLFKEFQRKFADDEYVDDFSSAFIFRENSRLQKVIHSLKYDANFNSGKFLGKKIADILNNKLISWNADLMIPIPLHKLRKADRGYNQSGEIVKGLASTTNIKFENNILKRKRFTPSQTKLTMDERKNNVEGAFTIENTKIIQSKKIILVDDVITTGATMSECAKLLINNGADKVFGVSVAIAE